MSSTIILTSATTATITILPTTASDITTTTTMVTVITITTIIIHPTTAKMLTIIITGLVNPVGVGLMRYRLSPGTTPVLIPRRLQLPRYMSSGCISTPAGQVTAVAGATRRRDIAAADLVHRDPA